MLITGNFFYSCTFLQKFRCELSQIYRFYRKLVLVLKLNLQKSSDYDRIVKAFYNLSRVFFFFFTFFPFGLFLSEREIFDSQKPTMSLSWRLYFFQIVTSNFLLSTHVLT